MFQVILCFLLLVMILRKLRRIDFLPVAEQSGYKTLLLNFKSFNEVAPVYLQEL